MECTKRGLTSVAVCSTAFAPLGRLQASALACPDLPISVVPHPFGLLTREDIRRIAAPCAADIARLLCDSAVANSMAAQAFASTGDSAALIEVPEDPHELNRFFHEQRWSDGLPVVAPTREYVDLMLRHTRRAPNEVVAKIAPAFGAATVERIAINAVLAGCYPEYLPVLLAAVEAMAAPELNLQTIQSTTNPAGLWLIVNGPVADRLGINSGPSCLGPGSWANATMGRALRLIQQNIGGALPGVMDRATHGYPGKYTFCCAENEKLTPWEPLHVERGYARHASTVTLVGALGTLNLNTHSKNADDVLRVFADSMAYPAVIDYIYGGEPWLILSPEHADILKRAGYTKSEVKRRLWEQSKLSASRLADRDLGRAQNARRAELGEITRETLLPISVRADDIGIIVAGGAGTHSVYVPVCGGVSRSVTREVILSVL